MGKFWNKESKADNYSIQLCPQFCKEPHHLPSLQKDEHSPDKTKMKILETIYEKRLVDIKVRWKLLSPTNCKNSLPI